MEVKIIRVDPAGNITVFVMSPLPDSDSGAALVNALLNDPALGAQQVGFVTPPEKEGALWKLNMMGGEFCGNAARSFGLLVARETGLFGRVSLMIETVMNKYGLDKQGAYQVKSFSKKWLAKNPPAKPTKENMGQEVKYSQRKYTDDDINFFLNDKNTVEELIARFGFRNKQAAYSARAYVRKYYASATG